MSTKTKRMDGFLESVKEFIQTDKAKKSKLIEWLERWDAAEAESTELEKLSETLPVEIDELLAGGRMDEKTVGKLARNRAFLDLLPGRMEKLADELEKLADTEYADASVFVEKSAEKATRIYFDRQMEGAVSDLMALGVSADIAKQQAILRDDLQAIEPLSTAMMIHGSAGARARQLLFHYESFAVGLHPRSPEAETIRKKWFPNG